MAKVIIYQINGGIGKTVAATAVCKAIKKSILTINYMWLADTRMSL